MTEVVLVSRQRSCLHFQECRNHNCKKCKKKDRKNKKRERRKEEGYKKIIFKQFNKLCCPDFLFFFCLIFLSLKINVSDSVSEHCIFIPVFILFFPYFVQLIPGIVSKKSIHSSFAVLSVIRVEVEERVHFISLVGVNSNQRPLASRW